MTRHAWDLSATDAVALQRELAGEVRAQPLDVEAVRYVAGADLSANRGRGEVYAGIVVYDRVEHAVVEAKALVTQSDFPYVPGLLSFREVPPLLQVWEHLDRRPDALLCDGQGYAHPRRLGLACHLGLWLDLPTVGCAKSRYIGQHEPVGPAPGDSAVLLDGDETIGMVLRSRAKSNPLYVSRGHRCRLKDAVALVQACLTGHRLPEPTREAHLLVNRLRRGEVTGCDTN